MWLKTQTRGYVNSDMLLSIGTGADATGRALVVASLPAGQGVATAPLAGPFLDLGMVSGQDRAWEVCQRLVQKIARSGTAAVLDPAELVS